MKRADADREIDDLRDKIKWIERMRKLNDHERLRREP